MTGVIIGAVVFAVIIVYLIFTFAIAKFISRLIFTPPVKFRPTREMVEKNQVNEFASNHSMYSGADYRAYDLWETEQICLENKGAVIPAEFHPVPGARGCVILAHGFGQNRYAMVPYAEIYRKLGFSTVLFDERCFGESTADYGTFGDLEASDIAALIRWVKQRCCSETRIVLHGVSMGAMSCMNAMKLSPDIDYVIEDCGPARAYDGIRHVAYSMVPVPNPFLMPFIERTAEKSGTDIRKNNPVDAVAASEVPICVIHGDADTVVDVHCTEEIFQPSKNKQSRIEIFPGRGHAYSICDHDRYEAVVKDFLKELQ